MNKKVTICLNVHPTIERLRQRIIIHQQKRELMQWGLAVTSITQPGTYIASDKINDAAEGKRHQTAGENRKQNGGKQKTEQTKHGGCHTKDVDNRAKYSHFCNQTGDWSQIVDFYISLSFSNLRHIGASAHLQKQCFKTAKALRLGCQSIDFEGQTTCYRMVNCMLLD